MENNKLTIIEPKGLVVLKEKIGKKNIIIISAIILSVIILLGIIGGICKAVSTNTVKDEISGFTYIEKDEKMMLVLNADKTFKLNKDKNIENDYYNVGTYTVYNGVEIKKYIENNKEARFVSGLEKLMKKVKSSELPNTYYVVLRSEAQYINNKNEISESIDTGYFGNYNDDTKTLVLTNLRTNDKFEFIMQK